MDTTVTIELGPIASNLALPEEQVRRTVELLDDGNTVPFITRYRRDITGGLDEEQIRQVQDRVTRARMLAERKRTILKSIESQAKLTEALAAEIQGATSTKRLEDLYLPYKPKKQTLATIARDRGLEPLAREILDAVKIAEDLDRRALDFVDIDKGIRSQADVLLGVGHLIAERFSERADLREALRRIVRDTGKIVCSKIPPPEDKPSETSQEAAVPAEEKPPTDEVESEAESAVPTAQTKATSAEGSSTSTAVQAPADSPSSAEAEPDAERVQPIPAQIESPETPSAEVESVAESPPEAQDAQAIPMPETAASAELADEPAESTAPPGVDQVEAARLAAEAEKQAKREAEKEKRKQLRAERKKRKDEAKKRKRKQRENAYKDYFKFEEAIGKLPPHRVLAINRGERDRVLRVKLDADLDAMRVKAEELAIPAGHPHAEFLRGCLKDALTRLIFPAMEREVRRELTEKAEDHAVTVFARNLRHLLLTQPVSGQRVLAVDPGFRSGCKLAALDEFGMVHGQGAIFLVGPEERKQRSRARLVEMIKMHKITVVAIGNGTACRETEHLVADVLANELKEEDVSYVIVNEAGASVYSTSPVGREELGQYEAAQRSAVSIGRRLLDPLSELVKINPANIGVGLYQHDMKAKHLQNSLDAVVESCVNYVGVDLNTASPSLLRYVSGLNQLTARRLFEHRQQNGPFKSREQIREVPGVGEATFVQAAGFLKIAYGENPLDATWIHPESYDSARQILDKLGYSVEKLAAKVSSSARPAPFAAGLVETQVRATSGEEEKPSLEAVAAEQPGAAEAPAPDPPSTAAAPVAPTPDDAPSTSAAVPSSPPDVETPPATPADSPEQPAPGPTAPASTAPATETTSPTSEEASDSSSAKPVAAPAPEEAAEPKPDELAEKAAQVNVAELASELNIGQLLCQDILSSLTRPGRDPREDLPSPIFRREILKLEDLKPGMHLQGTVLNVVDFGAFVDIGLHDTGLVHISRLADRYIKDPHEVVGVGDTIDIWVMNVDKQRRRVQLTAIKPGTERPQRKRGERKSRGEGGPGKPRGDRKDRSGKAAEGQRSRKRRDRGDGKHGRRDHQRRESKPFELKSKQEPKKKLTKAKKEGRKPLQTFGELAQFLTQKEEPAPEVASTQPPAEKTQASPPQDAPVPQGEGADVPDVADQGQVEGSQQS